MCQFVGIDISKESFDVYFEDDGKGNYVKLNQTADGYKVLISLIGRDRVCVMESTGNYHVKLASYLFEEGVQVVVENPLKIKRYSQMRLQRTKTDKADSQIIFDYGETILSREEYHAWKPDSKHIGDLKQYDTVRQQLIKQQTALSNTEEALTCLSDLNKDVIKVLKEMVKAVEKALETLDKGMLELVTKHHADSFELITSIPGVGAKTATMMICLTDGFQKFQHNEVKQFISYIGMSPRTFNSGTSVKGRAHITKVGNGRIRSLLYMCSWTAKRYNQQCIDLYERLAEKGKPERVIKVAIAHKIVRQIFGVIKNGQPFSNEFA
jgi:transposase